MMLLSMQWPWLQSDAMWVPWCFIIKFFNAFRELSWHFNRVMEKLHVDPIKARIYRAGFTFLVTAHIITCAFFIVARIEGDDNTSYITTIPDLVTGVACIRPTLRGRLKRSARAVRAQCNYLAVWP